MRTETSRLLDLLRGKQQIKEFIAGLTQAQFESSRLHQDAIVRELEIIGEAARHVSEATKVASPQIEWAKIAGLRNRITHEYFQLDLETIWRIVQQEIDPLITALTPLVPPEE